MDLNSRDVVVNNATLYQAQAGTISVSLEAQGNENALGFSLAFDPVAFNFKGASLGSAASGAALNVNADDATSGKLGFVLALNSGANFSVGAKELIKVILQPTSQASGSYPVSLTDLPVPREVSDATASTLTSSYLNGTVTVSAVPSLNITRANQSVTLSWPLWASNFVLQEATAMNAGWTNVTGTAGTNASQNLITLPADSTAKFYRLQLP